MKHQCYLFLLPVIVFLFSACHSASNLPENNLNTVLEENFKTPPMEARPYGYWTWINGNYDSAEIWREIREAKNMGMGGFDIWDAPTVRDPDGVVPIGPDVVSDEFMKGVAIALDAARSEGIELGFVWNESVSYLDPELSHMALFHTTYSPEQSGQQTITLPFPEVKPHRHFGYKVLERDENGLPKHWGNVAVLAYPINQNDTTLIDSDRIVNLTNRINGHQLDWDVPEGKWKIIRFVWSRTVANGLTPTPATLKPALDFLNPKATEVHLKYMLDLMTKHTGPLENSPLKYFFTESYEFKGLWTPALPQIFKDSLNYDLTEYLPVFAGYTVDSEDVSKRFLFDFNNLRSELVIQNHYVKAKEVCAQYGVGFVAEAAGPGPPVHMDVPMETIRSSGILTFPRGEFWVEDVTDDRSDLQIIKGVASAAHLYNQPYVSAESFTGVHLWAYGPGDLKPYADKAFAEGLNRIYFHTFPHTPPKAGLPGWIYSFGNIISENLIWWSKSSGFMDYLGRSSYLLQQGNFVGDALYYHGEEAPYFAEPKHIKPELGVGYDYDVTNADILLNRLKVKDGKLVLDHGQQYEVLMLPESSAMSLAVLRKIEELLKQGATIIGNKPSIAHGLTGNDAEVIALANELWGNLDEQSTKERTVGKGKLIWGLTPREVLLDKGIIPDITFKTASPFDTLDYIHRKLDQTDIYFIRNPYDQEINALVTTRITDKQPEIWNPENGDILPLSIYTSAETATTLPLTLTPYESVFLVFRQEHPRQVTVNKEGVIIFPTEQVPNPWPFSDLGSGHIRLIDAEALTINNQKMTSKPPSSISMESDTWQIRFQDPWGEQFRASTDELVSWSAFDNPRVAYFSGSGTYQNRFSLTEELTEDDNLIVLSLSRVEEVGEVFINGESAGLAWTNPAKMDITPYVKPGVNTLEIQVVNRWPNRMIGDYKLPKPERKITSNITSLPSAWTMPLEQLPNADYPLPESGLIGAVEIHVYETTLMINESD